MLTKAQIDAFTDLFSDEIDNIFDCLEESKKEAIFNFYPYIALRQINHQELLQLARQYSQNKEEAIIGSINFIRNIFWGPNIVRNLSALGSTLTVEQYLQLLGPMVYTYMTVRMRQYESFKAVTARNVAYGEVIKRIGATLETEFKKNEQLSASLAEAKQRAEMAKILEAQTNTLRHDLLELQCKLQPLQQAANLRDEIIALKNKLATNAEEKKNSETQLEFLCKKQKQTSKELLLLSERQVDQSILKQQIAECQKKVAQNESKRKLLDKEVKAYTRNNKIDQIQTRCEQISELTRNIQKDQAIIDRATQLLDEQSKLMSEIKMRQCELDEIANQIKSHQTKIAELEKALVKDTRDLSILGAELKTSGFNLDTGKTIRPLPTPPQANIVRTGKQIQKTAVIEEVQGQNSVNSNSAACLFNPDQMKTYIALYKEVLVQITNLKKSNAIAAQTLIKSKQLSANSQAIPDNDEKTELLISKVKFLADIEDSIDISKNCLYHGCYISLLLGQVTNSKIAIHTPVIATNLYQCEQTLNTVNIRKFSKNYLFLPIDIGNYHWVAVLFDTSINNAYRVYYIDPLNKECPLEIISQIEKMGFSHRNIFVLPVKLQADHDLWNCGLYIVEVGLDLLREQQLAAKVNPIGLIERYKHLQKRVNTAEIRIEHLKVLKSFLIQDLEDSNINANMPRLNRPMRPK